MKKVCFYIVILLITCFCIYEWGIAADDNGVNKSVLIISSAASIIGVVISLFEIVGVKSKTEAIGESVKNTKAEVSKFVTYSDIMGMSSLIDELEAYIRNSQYESSLLKMKELKDKVSEFQGYIKKRQVEGVDLTQFAYLVKKIGIDINTLHSKNAGIGQADKIVMLQNLETTKDTLTNISGLLKAQKI